MKEALFFEKDRHINFLQWGWRQCFNYLSSLQSSPSLPQLHFFHVFHRGWLLLPGKRMWTCKFWYLSDMDRMKCVVWDFNVLLMEKHGLKHWSLVRWGSVGDVILERTLTFVPSNSGFEDSKMLQLFCWTCFKTLKFQSHQLLDLTSWSS